MVTIIDAEKPREVAQILRDGNVPRVRGGKFHISKGTIIAYNDARLTVTGNATAIAYGEATVYLHGVAECYACEHVTVHAYDKTVVHAYDRAVVYKHSRPAQCRNRRPEPTAAPIVYRNGQRLLSSP